MIYLDSAATSYHKPKSVAQAVYDAICTMGNSGRGSHTASLNSARMILETRQKCAALFGASAPEQVVFTQNATHSLNIAIGGCFHVGDHIITTAMEHNSVLRPLYRKQSEGAELTILHCDEFGTVRYDLIESAIQPNTKGIVCTHASNVTGNIVDVAKIGALCKKHGLLFIVDASQTAGAIPINMETMGIDILCFTGHKSLLGPQGTGGLCIREGIQIDSFCVGGSGVQSYLKTQPEQLPTHLEAGTLNAHGIAGLSASLDFLNETKIANIQAIEYAHTMQFYHGVKDIPNVKVYGDFTNKQRAPIVSLNIADIPSETVCDILSEEYEIFTRAGAHCAPLMHEQLGTVQQGAVRFSFSYFLKEQQIVTAIQAIRELAEEWTT